MKACTAPSHYGYHVGVWATALILIWLGLFKFTPTEAAAIRPLIENHFLMAWLYRVFSEQAVSNLIGVSEMAVGVALLLGWKKPAVGLWAGISGAVIFTVTLSFMFTTPETFKVIDGVFITDFFLFKDLAYLAICLTVITHNRALMQA